MIYHIVSYKKKNLNKINKANIINVCVSHMNLSRFFCFSDVHQFVAKKLHDRNTSVSCVSAFISHL